MPKRLILNEENPMRGLLLSLSYLSLILLVSLLVLSAHVLWAQRMSPLKEIPVRLFDKTAQPARVSDAQTHLHFTYAPLPLSFRHNQGQTELWMRLFPHHQAGDYRLPLTYAEANVKVHDETLYRVDELEYYGRHIPWAGSLMVRISQQAKVHPHVTRILKVLRPRF